MKANLQHEDTLDKTIVLLRVAEILNLCLESLMEIAPAVSMGDII